MIATSTITTETSTGRTALEQLRADEVVKNNAALTYQRTMTEMERCIVARCRERIQLLNELIALEKQS